MRRACTCASPGSRSTPGTSPTGSRTTSIPRRPTASTRATSATRSRTCASRWRCATRMCRSACGARSTRARTRSTRRASSTSWRTPRARTRSSSAAALLANAPKHKRVLEIVAEKAGWGKPLPPGVFRGIAVENAYGSYQAVVAEVSVSERGALKVHRIVNAIDCGHAVNTNIIEQQMQGSVVMAMSAMLYGENRVERGRVVDREFRHLPVDADRRDAGRGEPHRADRSISGAASARPACRRSRRRSATRSSRRPAIACARCR